MSIAGILFEHIGSDAMQEKVSYYLKNRKQTPCSPRSTVLSSGCEMHTW